MGDDVGCCLATTNDRFHAMVQRRMDDAMLFHVAIDLRTGRPVALIWLYLAIVDGKIALVANFFEVAAKYAQNDDLRLALLNGLLYFTACYCMDNPGISAFYMNRLTYGWNINDLDHYRSEEISSIEKLGGPYIPDFQDAGSSPEIRAETQTIYYLESLKNNYFHRFNTEDYKPNFQVLVSVDAMITNAAFKWSTQHTLEETQQKIADQYRFDFASFFSEPLEQDLNFCANVHLNWLLARVVTQTAQEHLAKLIQSVTTAATYVATKLTLNQVEDEGVSPLWPAIEPIVLEKMQPQFPNINADRLLDLLITAEKSLKLVDVAPFRENLLSSEGCKAYGNLAPHSRLGLFAFRPELETTLASHMPLVQSPSND